MFFVGLCCMGCFLGSVLRLCEGILGYLRDR